LAILNLLPLSRTSLESVSIDVLQVNENKQGPLTVKNIFKTGLYLLSMNI